MTNTLQISNEIKAYANDFSKNATQGQKKAEGAKESFAHILSQLSGNLMHDIDNVEKSMNALSNGDKSPEEVIPQIKAVTVEAEGVMAIIKGSVESTKQILNIQI